MMMVRLMLISGDFSRADRPPERPERWWNTDMAVIGWCNTDMDVIGWCNTIMAVIGWCNTDMDVIGWWNTDMAVIGWCNTDVDVIGWCNTNMAVIGCQWSMTLTNAWWKSAALSLGVGPFCDYLATKQTKMDHGWLLLWNLQVSTKFWEVCDSF